MGGWSILSTSKEEIPRMTETSDILINFSEAQWPIEWG